MLGLQVGESRSCRLRLVERLCDNHRVALWCLSNREWNLPWNPNLATVLPSPFGTPSLVPCCIAQGHVARLYVMQRFR